MKAGQRRDRRVEQSRVRLHQSLVALILERGWDRVSVQDVCARAEVGRSTFYAHFADKEDLLVSGLDNVRDGLLDQIRSEGPRRRPFAFVRGFIAHADGSRRLFRAVIGKRSGPAVQRRFRQVVRELLQEDLASQGLGGPAQHTTALYLTGALTELLTSWVDSRNSLSASQIEDTFVRLSDPVLRAARRDA
jgi:AcrR family transcriptional regulator